MLLGISFMFSEVMLGAVQKLAKLNMTRVHVGAEKLCGKVFLALEFCC